MEETFEQQYLTQLESLVNNPVFKNLETAKSIDNNTICYSKPASIGDEIVSDILSAETALETDAFTTPVISTPTQLLMPTTSWSWDVVTTGTITANQFDFSDTMPKSNESSTLYAPSSSSFSDNYRTFLEVLPNSFPQGLLTKAKTKITEPMGSPSNTPTPDGWTKVSVSGITRWKPIYSVSTSAYQWKNDVKTGTVNNPGTIIINLKDEANSTVPSNDILSGTPDDSSSSPQLDSSAFEKVSITADSWGQISIYLGDWYDSGVISLSKAKPEWKQFLKTLLSVRVSAFFVAYKPDFKFSSSTPVDDSVLKAISATKDLYAMGVKINTVEQSSNNKSVNLKSSSPDPSIVAVVLETFS